MIILLWDFLVQVQALPTGSGIRKSQGPNIQNSTKRLIWSYLQVCLSAHHKNDKWYLNSGCSRHMTGDNSILNNIKKWSHGNVTFGNSSKGKITGIRNVENEHITILEVHLVTELRYNLLSISQLCGSGHKVSFSPTHCSIFDQSSKLVLYCSRKNNV